MKNIVLIISVILLMGLLMATTHTSWAVQYGHNHINYLEEEPNEPNEPNEPAPQPEFIGIDYLS